MVTLVLKRPTGDLSSRNFPTRDAARDHVTRLLRNCPWLRQVDVDHWQAKDTCFTILEVKIETAEFGYARDL